MEIHFGALRFGSRGRPGFVSNSPRRGQQEGVFRHDTGARKIAFLDHALVQQLGPQQGVFLHGKPVAFRHIQHVARRVGDVHADFKRLAGSNVQRWPGPTPPAASGHIRNQSSGSTISNSDTAQAPFKSRTMSTRAYRGSPMLRWAMTFTATSMARSANARSSRVMSWGTTVPPWSSWTRKFDGLLLHGMGHGAPQPHQREFAVGHHAGQKRLNHHVLALEQRGPKFFGGFKVGRCEMPRVVSSGHPVRVLGGA